MGTWNKVNEEERETIENYLKDGISASKISELTGRGLSTVVRIKNAMNDEKETIENVVELPTKEVEKTPEPEDTVRDHRDDPRFASNISIQMVAKIVGNKTGYGYRADFAKKLMTITNAEGIQFELEFNMVEKFLDEMIDVSVEVGDLKKKFA